MTNATPIQYVGVDDGHYAIKIVTEQGQTFSIPSRAAHGRQIISLTSEDSSGAFYETEDGSVYTVSPYLEKYISTRTADYPTSSTNRVLVHDALRHAGYGGKEVIIATGLPVSHYYLEDMINQRLIDGKKANLMKPLSCSSGPLAKIVQNIVTTEAIAAYFDQIMDMNGKKTEKCNEILAAGAGVIDIGGRTTDCAVVYPRGTQVDVSRSGSSDIGMLKLEERVKAYLRSKFELDNVPPILISRAISTDTVRISNQEHDISEKMSTIKREIWSDIYNSIMTRLGNGRDLEYLFIVGGGSLVLQEFIKNDFGHAIFPDEPAFSNARGMLKIVKYVHKGLPGNEQ